MNTAPTAANQAAPGYVVPADQLAWDWSDWLDSYDLNTYPSSVILAASEEGCELSSADLRQLLKEHSHTVHELEEDLAQGHASGHAVLPLWHAGQALSWLGY
jgi:hypothetical protein